MGDYLSTEGVCETHSYKLTRSFIELIGATEIGQTCFNGVYTLLITVVAVVVGNNLIVV